MRLTNQIMKYDDWTTPLRPAVGPSPSSSSSLTNQWGDSVTIDRELSKEWRIKFQRRRPDGWFASKNISCSK